MNEVREYVDSRGCNPFADWYKGLEAVAAAKVAVALERMRQGNLGDVKSVGSGVVERRIPFGPGMRINLAGTEKP